MKADPSLYTHAYHYFGDAQVAAFFSKYKGLPLDHDLKKAAIESFWNCERQCFQTNERLSPLHFDSCHYGERIQQFLAVWRKKIRFVLGRAPLKTSLVGKFGPGSTFCNKGDLITLADKLSEDYTMTEQAKSFLHSWDMTAWSRYAACGLDTVGDTSVAEHHGFALYPKDEDFAIRDFLVVRGNRFTTVPKDSKKDRGIGVEPSLNVFFQLAIGEKISDRMKRTLGWDKKSCQDFHKSLARIGSLTGSIATLDLSNASDTLCSSLVRLLLPHDWYALVQGVRSTHTAIAGKWVRLEKFSSMGNGFTFELETLIFRTLCDTVIELEGSDEDPYTPGLTTSVFGDDIICPTSNASSITAALRFFGFSLNEAKSFVTGSFRESCGGDYFNGHDVRPHYQKEVCDQPHKLISLANGLRRYARRNDSFGIGNHSLAPWFECLRYIPTDIRKCRGPEELGDIVICDSDERWRAINPTRVRSSIRYLRVWRPVANTPKGWEHYRPGVQLSVALYGGSSGSSSSYNYPFSKPSSSFEDWARRSGVIPRINGSYVSGYRHGRVAFS